MNQIRQFIERITPMNDSDWQFFSSKLKTITLHKHTHLLEMGETENALSFITKGIVRLYIPRAEQDLTFGFLFENEFVTAYDSFLTQMPSEYQIETLTETTLWRISHRDLHEVYEQTHSGNIIGRKMAEKMFLIKSKRELALLSKTAEERYLDLFSDRPKLLQQIPLKYIASYIGVTPQALSRIRKRIT
ncbi:cAMP-binding domain of CRP or a regulatory subunit of cAMP-dependent protein kinases [Reichenbachiella agariperforans]|uniref:cAMP-binding domain of CRP or a regulatory subunit of cAMP-dependent protein kinases n=1 Tax=Reichenbachiella agariperforans TaxID=156994 RepID=A0A1M6Q249_REIAG|nr:Crp/Fnr family transcriptional regulator [Reichenbachiella agariperforans]SHK14290.1 cAMP-binding domain of CRP or a regulatory subunit of cAMP-dependent protein kinases [Reichenbachiella agariperforans]